MNARWSVNGSRLQVDLEDIFRRVGAEAALHIREVDGNRELGREPDDLVVTASVFKVPVLLELVRQAAAGEIDLTERTVVPAKRRSPGPTGIAAMLDDVELSLRDLALLMMSVSDNTATDVLMERIGVDRIAATLASLGLERTVVAEDCAALLAGLVADLGFEALDEAVAAVPELEPALLARARALVAAETNRTTPREMTTLLSLIWRDEAGPAEACAEVRRIMALQVWPHRLMSGFSDRVVVAGKTGTLPGIRNEVGVVTYPDGSRYAIAVFTRARTYTFRQPAIDAAIGRAAYFGVEAIRAGRVPTP